MTRIPRRTAPLPALLLVVGVVVATGLLGSPAAAEPSPAPGTSTAAPPVPGQTQEERGRSLYQSSCASCHGQAGEGSQRGPTLVGVGPASVDFWVGTGRMPLAEEQGQARRGPPAFDGADIDALVAYVSSFGGGGPAIPRVRPGELTLGRELFLQNCAACHSSSGTGYTQVGGRVAPSLMESTPVQVAEAVRIGPGVMPQWPEEVLDQQQLDAVVTYVQELQRMHGQGGADLGRIGPVAETVVGFAAVAALLVIVRGLGKRAGR
jgi:ubiquinol-cytochrome c reductase cytochrome c subunit